MSTALITPEDRAYILRSLDEAERTGLHTIKGLRAIRSALAATPPDFRRRYLAAMVRDDCAEQERSWQALIEIWRSVRRQIAELDELSDDSPALLDLVRAGETMRLIESQSEAMLAAVEASVRGLK
jgi:hypothetical protein